MSQSDADLIKDIFYPEELLEEENYPNYEEFEYFEIGPEDIV